MNGIRIIDDSFNLERGGTHHDSFHAAHINQVRPSRQRGKDTKGILPSISLPRPITFLRGLCTLTTRIHQSQHGEISCITNGTIVLASFHPFHRPIPSIRGLDAFLPGNRGRREVYRLSARVIPKMVSFSGGHFTHQNFEVSDLFDLGGRRPFVWVIVAGLGFSLSMVVWEAVWECEC